MALPLGTTGSLGPAFAPARLVGLTVRPASALSPAPLFPPVGSRPLSPPFVVKEPPAPVKLPTWHCPRPGSRAQVRTTARSGWYLNDGSTEASAPASKPPTYPAQTLPEFHTKI